MRFEKRYISHERCEEINRMNIICPWSSEVNKMNEKGSKYIASEDESIIYGTAFLPSPLDLASNLDKDLKDYCLLVVNNEFFLHSLELVSYKKEMINDVLHVYKSFELPDDEKINDRDDKDAVPALINFLNYHLFCHNKRKVSKQVLIYNGREYTGEGVGEYVGT